VFANAFAASTDASLQCVPDFEPHSIPRSASLLFQYNDWASWPRHHSSPPFTGNRHSRERCQVSHKSVAFQG
jgi:hypothetical protein